MPQPFSSAHPAARTVIAFIAVCLLFGSSSLLAAIRTWTGGSSVNNFWSTPQNWSGGAAPLPGDDLAFPTAASRATSFNNFPAGTAFGTLFVDSHTMSGAAIALNNGISASAGQIQLSSIKLNAGQTFFFHGLGAINISSAIETDGRSLTLDSATNLNVSGVISGSGTITKTGDVLSP